MAQLGLFGDPPTEPPKPARRATPSPAASPPAPLTTAPSTAPPPTAPLTTAPPAPSRAASPPTSPTTPNTGNVSEAARAPLPRRPPVDVEAGPFSNAALAKELNEPQAAAVTTPGQALLVVAGAGSGKTRVITYRIARRVAAGSDPRRILSVTFTNKAAGEMRERVAHLLWQRLGISANGLWLGTFHALSLEA